MQFTVKQLKSLCTQLSAMLDVVVEYAPVHHDTELGHDWINCPHGYEHRRALQRRGILPQFNDKIYRLNIVMQLRGAEVTVESQRCRIAICPICGGYILVG